MLLNNFIAGFLLYNFHANMWWWIGFILVVLFEVIYELDELEKERIRRIKK